MKKSSPLNGLVIRTAVVAVPDRGYILAADLKKEKDDVPHALVFRWAGGKFTSGDLNYNAHSMCLIQAPEEGMLCISGQGYYSVNTAKGPTHGDILESSQPRPKKPRTASFRSVASIAGKAYAVGLRGLVYRFDSLKSWTRIDDGLPDTFNAQAIDGFDDSEIYSVGRHGSLWQFDGKSWYERELPTNINLTSVKCADDGNVYIAGHEGVLLCGRKDRWELIDHQKTNDDIWDIECFDKRIFISTMQAVYQLDGDALVAVDFGKDSPKTCYQLSAGPGVLWSNGELDIMSYDGKKWVRVV